MECLLDTAIGGSASERGQVLEVYMEVVPVIDDEKTFLIPQQLKMAHAIVHRQSEALGKARFLSQRRYAHSVHLQFLLVTRGNAERMDGVFDSGGETALLMTTDSIRYKDRLSSRMTRAVQHTH